MAKYKLTESVNELPQDLGQLIDVDPLEDGRYAAIFQHDDKQIVSFLDQIFPIPVALKYPKIRVIDENRFLIAASRNKRQAKDTTFLTKRARSSVILAAVMQLKILSPQKIESFSPISMREYSVAAISRQRAWQYLI